MNSVSRLKKGKKLTSFSCDFCKKRKIACRRLLSNENVSHNSQTNEGFMSCQNCLKRGIPCRTKIQRKKKNVLHLKDLGYHHKCLAVIVGSLYPSYDIASITSLQRLAEKLQIELPNLVETELDCNANIELLNDASPQDCRDSEGTEGNFQQAHEVKNMDYIISGENQTAHSSPSSAEVNLENSEPVLSEKVAEVKQCKMPSESISRLKLLKTTQFGKDSYTCDFFYDKNQNFHYVGPFGSSSLAMGLLHYVTKKACSNLSKLKYYRVRRATVIDSSHKAIDMNAVLYSNYHNNFAYLSLPNTAELLLLVELFFDRVPIFVSICVDKKVVTEKVRKFVKIVSLSNEGSCPEKLTIEEICTIYMIIVLGRIYSPNKNESLDFKLISIVRFALSDLCLTPSIDGIRAIFLLSTYMNQTRKRESCSVLIQLCLTQSIALGLHIDSIIENIFAVNSAEKDTNRNLWWAIFSSAVLISIQMGKICYEIDHTPSIPYNVVEKGISVSSLNFSLYAKLSLLSARILKYRTMVSGEEDLLSGNSLKIYIHLTDEFLKFRKPNLPTNILDYHIQLVESTIEIYQTFFYYFHSLTLPILSILLNKPTFFSAYYNGWSESTRQNVVKSIIVSIQYAMECIDVAIIACEYNLFDNKFFNQVYYIYHAAIVILIAYALLYDLESAESSGINLAKEFEENDITTDKLRRSLRLVIIINDGNWDSVIQLSSFKYHQNTLIIVNDMTVATANSLKLIYEGSEIKPLRDSSKSLTSNLMHSNSSDFELDFPQNVANFSDVFDLFTFNSFSENE